MNRFAKDTTITLTGMLASLLIGLAPSIIIARILGPQDKGVYSLAILLPTLVFTLINMGISPSTVYHVSRGKYDLKKIFGNNLILGGLISGLGIAISLVLAVSLQSTFLKGVSSYYLMLATAIIPVLLIYGYLLSMLLGLREFKKYNLAIVLRSAFLFLFSVLLLIVFRGGVTGATLAEICSILLPTLFVFIWLKKMVGSPSCVFDREYTKDLCLYGAKAHIGSILTFLNYRMDMLLLNLFSNPLAVGFYSISVSIAEKLWLISQSASTVLFPIVASEEREENKKRLTPIISRNVFFITIVGAVFTYFAGEWFIVLLFSEAYFDSVRPLQVLLPGIISLSLSGVLSNDISARGMPLINSYYSFISLIINLILNILFIPRMGISGAALASSISYSVTTVGRVVTYKKISGNSIWETVVIQKSDMKLYQALVSQAFNSLRKH